MKTIQKREVERKEERKEQKRRSRRKGEAPKGVHHLVPHLVRISDISPHLRLTRQLAREKFIAHKSSNRYPPVDLR